MSQKESKIPQEIYQELLEIRKFIRIIAYPAALEQIRKLASTNERKIVWVHCTGGLTRDEISRKTGVKKRALDLFLEACEEAGLIEEEKKKGGHPKRVIDYVPDEWERIARAKRPKPVSAQPSAQK